MGKMKEALVKLAKKIAGKEPENKDSISNVLNYIADNYSQGEQPHLGTLMVGYSEQDSPIYIVSLISDLFTEFDDNFDGVETIDGLYAVLNAVGYIDYRFEHNQQTIKIGMAPRDNVYQVSMYVGNSKVLEATVDSDDNITYTISDDYFYIKYTQLF